MCVRVTATVLEVPPSIPLQACLVSHGFRVRALPPAHTLLVRHTDSWTPNLKAELATLSVARVLSPSLPPAVEGALEYYRAVGLLVAAGVVAAPKGLPELHPDAAFYNVPSDVQVPLRGLPLSWQLAPRSSVLGAWPARMYDTADVLRLSLGASPRRARVLAAACGTGQYFNPDSQQCAQCSLCGASQVVSTSCTATADTVCIGA